MDKLIQLIQASTKFSDPDTGLSSGTSFHCYVVLHENFVIAVYDYKVQRWWVLENIAQPGVQIHIPPEHIFDIIRAAIPDAEQVSAIDLMKIKDNGVMGLL